MEALDRVRKKNSCCWFRTPGSFSMTIINSPMIRGETRRVFSLEARVSLDWLHTWRGKTTTTTRIECHLSMFSTKKEAIYSRSVEWCRYWPTLVDSTDVNDDAFSYRWLKKQLEEDGWMMEVCAERVTGKEPNTFLCSCLCLYIYLYIHHFFLFLSQLTWVIPNGACFDDLQPSTDIVPGSFLFLLKKPNGEPASLAFLDCRLDVTQC